MNWNQRHSRYGLMAGVWSLLWGLSINLGQLQAASAVATGIDSNGRVAWGWAAGDNLEDAKSRAIEYCREHGAKRPKIVLFTPARGYGAIVLYKEAGNAVNVAASIGDPTEKQAVANALKKAKAAKGYTPKLWRTWHDFPVGQNSF